MVTLVPEAIDARRVELGMSLTDFAKRTNLCEPTLRAARAGKLISLSTARTISTVLRCPLGKLVSSAKPKFNVKTSIQPEVRAAI